MAGRLRSHRRSPRAALTPYALLAVGAVVVLLATLLVALNGGDGGKAATVATATSEPATTPPPTHRETTASASPSKPPNKHKRATPTPTKRKPTTNAPKPSSTPPSAAVHSQTGALAGRIRPGATYKGTATFYDAQDGDGACTYGPAGTTMTAAMNTLDYETSKACGAYVRVRASSGATITVRITNECPAPCAPGQLDLSAEAFAQLAAPVKGQIPITWSLVSPSSTKPIALRYKTGSSQHWCGIQALDHRNPLARLEVRTASGWRSLPRTDYNYFLAEDGNGCGTSSIRLTDIYGEQLTVTGIALSPNTVQRTGAQFAAH
ncbi:expansin EXLX1 family cellulose-binding protein [Streptomyces sp. NPDC052225]|uniref:expansin EXLX1 family cellulose-binding protein n=1 Tax=Streptomyces sp. NPDC052225 TaxID=3154949 RepID=UPI0034269AC9